MAYRNQQKRRATRKLKRWHRGPFRRDENYWITRRRKGRGAKRGLAMCWGEDGRSYFFNLETHARTYINDWTESTSYSTVEI